jgi:putative hydrolase of the HAD superfamily
MPGWPTWKRWPPRRERQRHWALPEGVSTSRSAGRSASAVIFDLDDTLVVDVATAAASFEAVGRQLVGDECRVRGGTMHDAVRTVWRGGPEYRLCSRLGLASREGLWSTFDGNHPSLDGLRRWIPTYRTEAWTAVLATLGLDDPRLIPVAEEIFVAAQRNAHAPLRGAVDAARAVAAGRRLALLTNGPSDVQRLKLRGTGLTPLFETLAISGERGVGKPTAAAFERVLADLGLAPQEALMVGDSWERDVDGAVSCGLPVVWISSGRPVPAQRDGVTVIETIEELAEVLP